MTNQGPSKNFEDFLRREYDKLRLNFGDAVNNRLAEISKPGAEPSPAQIDSAMDYVFLNNRTVQNQMQNFLSAVNKALQSYQTPRGDSLSEKATLSAGNQTQYKDTDYRPKDGMSSPGINQDQSDKPSADAKAENRNELKLGLYAKFKMSGPKLQPQQLKNELKHEYKNTPKPRPM